MSQDAKTAHQPPGQIFPWPKGWKLTALDEAILAIPAAILSDNDIIGSVIHAEDDVRLHLPTGRENEASNLIQIFLKPGQSVFLTKSCQAFVVPVYDGDDKKRRFNLSKVEG